MNSLTNNKNFYLSLLSQESALKDIQFERGGRIVRKKIKVSRTEIFENAIYAFQNYTNKKAILEFEYINEEGSGLGPTLEFYTTIIEIIKQETDILKVLEDGTYMLNVKQSAEAVKIKGKHYEVNQILEMMGSLIARAIVDERTIDLPLSNSFWKVLVNRSIGLAEIKDIDSNVLGFIKALE